MLNSNSPARAPRATLQRLLQHTGLALSLSAALPAGASSQYQEVVVTGTRTPVALADSLASVAVVSRARLEQLQATALTDVLSQATSLDISNSGGAGSQTSLYTRGTANGHTLILVDGQRISSATLGSANVQFLNPDQIERIEIVRGSRSSLYGSDAIGGVVQIFTRDGSASSGSYISAGAGSHNLNKLAAGTSGKQDSLRYGLHVSRLQTDGFDNLIDDTGNNSDDDGYRNRSVNASVGYEFASGADIALRYLESHNRNEYDSAFSPATEPYSISRIQNINLQGSLPITDFWTSSLSLGTARDDSDDKDRVSGLNTGDFRTTREQLFWQNDLTLAEGHTLTLGYDYFEDEVEASTNYAESSRDNEALFVQYQGQVARLDMLAGYRKDDNEAFGTHETANAALGLTLSEQYRLVLGWSEGFKAPTFNDMYWPEGPYSAGNPDLEPEQSKNLELSLQGNHAQLDWALTWFRNDVKNLIDWAPGPDFVWRPYNVSNAEIKGAELTFGANLWDWQWNLGYSYIEPLDAESDTMLIKRSRNNLNLSADREFGALSLGVSVKAQDQRYSNSDNSQRLGGYATAAVRLGYRLSSNLEANLKLQNVLDQDYRLNRGYNQDGFNWLASVTYRL